MPILLALFLVSCAPPTARILASATPSVPAAVGEDFPEIPLESRIATRIGDPRPPAYWALWNACAPDNRAEIARANGGRAAGWFIVDDLLQEPGIQLGDQPVETCSQAVSLLQGRTASGQETDDPAIKLAAQLLAAELNLNAGAETCPIAEEVVFGAHLVLSNAHFDGLRTTLLDAEASGAVPELIELLTAYNLGDLCR